MSERKRLTAAEGNALADEAFKALDHPIVNDCAEELCFNLRIKYEGLPRYGIRKLMQYAAIVARCHALGIDPEEMRMTNEEADDLMLKMADGVAGAGKPVIVIVP